MMMKKLLFVLGIVGAILCMQSCICAHDCYDYDYAYAPGGYYSRPAPVRYHRPAPPPPPSHRGHYRY